MRRPNEDRELGRDVVSWFSCGDKCMLVILEASQEEKRELVLHRVRHADSDRKICSLNLLSEGEGAQCWLKIDQFPGCRRDKSGYGTKAAEWMEVTHPRATGGSRGRNTSGIGKNATERGTYAGNK